jgi:putative transposase
LTFCRRRLPHLQRDSKPHFVTFCTFQHWRLPDNAREIVLNSCLHDKDTRYNLRVIVVMPDHVHLILTPLLNEKEQMAWPMPKIMDAIKGASAHLINKTMSREGPVWQQESFDRVLRSSESLDAKIQYVGDNPVRSGLVVNSADYKWLWYQEQQNQYAPPNLTKGRPPPAVQPSKARQAFRLHNRDASTQLLIQGPRHRPGKPGPECAFPPKLLIDKPVQPS